MKKSKKILKEGQILVLLILLNWGLLIFYFSYHTQDQDFNLSQTTMLINNIFNRHFEHGEVFKAQQERQPDTFLEEENLSEEEEFGEEEVNSQENVQEFLLYDDVNGTLQTIGDDDVETNYEYTVQAIKEINPIPEVFLALSEQKRKQTQLNLLKDNHYCNLNNLYIFTHQQFPINIITDYATDSPIAMALDKAGVDVLPNVQLDSNKLYHLPYQATVFFMENLNFHKYFELGTELLCNFQSYNHIPGIEVLFSKSSLISILSRLNIPQPITFIMNNKTQCHSFFDQLKDISESEYIIKNFVKRLVSQQSLELKLVRRKYQEGEICGKVLDDFIIQRRVENKQKRFFALLLISLVDPLQYQIFDGFYYKVIKGVPADHQRYNGTISKMVSDQVEQFIHTIDIIQDNRFFSLLRMEFIEADQIFLLSVNSNIDRDPTIQDYMTSVIVSSLQLINFQQQQRLSLLQHLQMSQQNI